MIICRQAALKAVRKCSVKEVTPAFMLVDKAEVMTELMMLPSAQPERTGKWVMNDHIGTFKIFTCSECGWNSEAPFNFCPHCGVYMGGKR